MTLEAWQTVDVSNVFKENERRQQKVERWRSVRDAFNSACFLSVATATSKKQITD